MPPNHLYTLARADILSPTALEYALRRIGTIPDAGAWRRFIDYILLLIGTASLLAGIIFFFAYNWADLTRFAKFSVLQASVLGIALFASWRGLEHLSGQAALLAAAVLVGTLLAVYGQVYQTGADSFRLFLVWAILIIPWVLLGNFAPLWLLLLLLINLSLILYWAQVINLSSYHLRTDLFLVLFFVNGVAMLAWEYAHTQSVAWLRGQWFGILIFGAILTVLIIPTLHGIIDLGDDWQENLLFAVAALLYVAVTALALWYYRYQRHDLLLLAMSLLSVIIVLTTLIAKFIPLRVEITWLILALVIIGQATLASKWLLHIAKIEQEETQ